MDRISAFVLAGGKSTRMGQDKAFLNFEGATLLDRALRTAAAVSSKVSIVGDADKFSAFGTVIEDEYRDRGPLGGIHAALRTSKTERNLILAVDLPFVSVEFLRFLIVQSEGSAALVTCPWVDGQTQPLSAIYRQKFGDLAEAALRAGQNRINRLFTPEVARVLAPEEWQAGGFSGNMFRNLNSPQDLAAAQARVEHAQ